MFENKKQKTKPPLCSADVTRMSTFPVGYHGKRTDPVQTSARANPRMWPNLVPGTFVVKILLLSLAPRADKVVLH